MFGALPYLELRIAVNQARTIARSPWRLLAWLAYFVYAGVMIYLRSHNGLASRANSLPSRELATTFAGLAMLVVGISIFTGTGNSVRPFRTRADAALLSRAGVSARSLVLWLQFRAIVGRSWYFIGFAFFYGGVLTPMNGGLPLFGLVAILTVFVSLVAATIPLPVFLAALQGWRMPLRVVGGGIMAVGAFFSVDVGINLLAKNAHLPHTIAAGAALYVHVVPLGPGDVFRSALGGNPTLEIVLIAIVVAATFAASALARDIYPELCQASFALFDRVSRVRRGEMKASNAAVSRRVPLGAAVLLWKNSLTFARSPSVKSAFIVMTIVSIGLGMLLGFVVRDPDPADLVIASGLPLLLLALVGFLSSFALAVDVGKPYWWLTGGSLFARLVYWTIGESRRPALIFGAGILAETIVGEMGFGSIAPTLAAVAAWWGMYAVGTLIFVIVPGSIDRRGPGMVLRLIASGVPLIAIILTSGLSYVVFHNVTVAFVVMTLAALGFGFAAVALAAARLAYGGGAQFAIAAAEQV